MTTLVHAPSFPTLRPGEIVALSIENAGAKTLDAGIASFGQVFAQGDLVANGGLVALIGGTAVPVQIDVKTTWPDGSVKMAVLSISRPELAAGQSLDVVLAAAPAVAAPAVDLAAVIAGHSFSVDLAIVGRAPLSIDVLAALETALADGSASFWQQGSLATEARVQIPVEGTSMRLVFDVTAYANGEISVSARFANDRAMEAVGGRLDYTVHISMNGAEVARETVSQAQYQSWHRGFATGADGGQGTGAPTEGWLNIRHDIGYLQQTGAVPHYDLTLGVVASRLQAMERGMAADSWGAPLSNNGVTMAMPTTGGRADIGFTTAHNATWLMTGDARAAAYSLGQAEASGSVPWNMFDLANGTWLNTDNYPRLWVDGRGGTGRPGDPTSTGLTQQVANNTGWQTSTAHQPNLNLIPYVLTGERWILDNLNAQAAWNVMNQWPARARLPDGTDLVINDVQTRAAAWSLREIEGAAWANPDGSVERAYFNSVSAENWSWIVSKIPEWTALQGEAHGWLPTAYVSGFLDRVTPWQQDFFASTAIAAASRGNEDALTYLKWASNFLVGRFLNEADGFEMRDGIAMNIAVGAQDRTHIYTTWREIGEQTVARNWANGNDFWTQSNNYNGQLALATLAGIWRLTGNEDAREAYLKLLAERPPFTGLQAYQSDPTYAVALPGVIASPPPQVFPAPEFRPIANFLDPTGATLSVVLAGDAWNGAPIAAVLVNGIELWRGEVTATRGSAGQEVALGSVKPGADYRVEVRFVNDATDFSSANDRNLYVMAVKVDGRATGDERVLWGNGAYVASVPVGDVGAVPDRVASVGAGPDVVRLALSGDAWREYPKFVVLVDGKRVGDTLEVTATEARGQVQFFDVRGDFGGSHNVTIRFLNDGFGGGPLFDRNLFVKAVAINGVDLQQSASLTSSGDATFAITRPAVSAPPPTPATTSVGTGADVVRIQLAQDAWLGNAQFHLLLNGTQVGGVYEAAALRSAGQSDVLELRGDFGASANSVGIRFINDAWGGGAGADRNLYISSVTLNGTEIGKATTLGTNGTATFSFGTAASTPPPTGTSPPPTSPTPPPPTASPTGPLTVAIGSGPDVIEIGIAQDAWMGNAKYVVLVNGVQVGGTLEAGALRSSGQSDIVRVGVDLLDGVTNTVAVRFLNDAFGGTAATDRNLYVTSVAVNGTDLARTANLMSNGEARFAFAGPTPGGTPGTITIGSGPDVIEIGIAQDAWMGNAKYVVLVNGVQVGGTLEAGALRGSGQSDIVRVGVDLLDGVMNTVAVRFLNDAFGGTAATDRNLYVTSVAVNGTDLARTANLMSNGEARFSFMRPPPSTPPDTTPPAVEITAIEGGDDIINAEEAAGGIAISGSVEAGAQVVVNGVAATVTGTSWTATLPAPASDGAFGVSVTATDAAGNAATVTRSLTVDRVAPSAIITISDAALTAGETAIVSIVFSEAVTGFCVDDLDLSDAAGELGPLTTADGIRWEAVFTPISDVIDVTNVIRLLAGGHADAAGNPGLGAQSANFMIDTRVPFYSASAGSVNEGDTLSFTVTRSVAIAAETLEFALGGTALAGVDYVAPASFRIAFAEGQSVATVSVATLRDTVAETNETVTFSLRGAGGAELLSVTGTIRDATIVGTRNADVLTGTSGVDLIMGQNGNDSVNGLDGNDSISGGEGADTLAGGLGADTLSGGPGNDIFIYSDVAESPVGPAVADLIVDFVPGADRIHLAGIDANTLLAGHQAFGWGGQSTAVMRNGVTWFQDAASGTTIVRLEVNGDPVADAEIRLSGLLTLSASDFVL